MKPDRKITEVLEAFAALELERWTGLPRGITLEHLRERFDVDDEWRGVGRLGSRRGQADWYSVAADGFPHGLRLWFRDAQLILADARRPALPTGLEELLDALGPPQARLDAYLGTLLIEESEWVWADRGLTLFVNPANRRLLRIAVYRPCGLSDYEEALRLDLKTIRLPPRRRLPEGVR